MCVKCVKSGRPGNEANFRPSVSFAKTKPLWKRHPNLTVTVSQHHVILVKCCALQCERERVIACVVFVVMNSFRVLTEDRPHKPCDVPSKDLLFALPE